MAFAAIGLSGATACGAPDSASADDSAITRADLLLEASDLPPGGSVSWYDEPDEMVLSLNIHAPAEGIGLDMNPVFDPAECEEESLYADSARAGLIENGSGSSVHFERGGAYFVMVSETSTDVARVTHAHTGQCSDYTVTSTSFDETTSRHTTRTEQLDLPGPLAVDAVALHEVRHYENLGTTYEMLLGYALVDKYTVVVLGHEGRESQAEFEDVLTQAVEKVRRLG